MAIRPDTNGTMAGRITAADANYPYGSSKDESGAGANDGTPYFKARADDIFGFQQALLTEAGITPSGNADTAINSQYLGAAKRVLKSGRKNYIINGNLNTTIVNQRAFGGGQPAAGVYGYDRWKGDALGTRIEQVVENTEVINETFVISWVGGTGTADVDGVSGLSSGDSFTLNTSGNFSVIVPTDATYVQLEKGSVATDFEEEHIADITALCQRYFFRLPDSVFTANYGASSFVDNMSHSFPFPTIMRTTPTISNLVGNAITGLTVHGTTSTYALNVIGVCTGTSSSRIESFDASSEL